MIDYLSADDIREIHQLALEEYNGTAGEHEPGSIDFMAQKPSMVSFGNELYPGLFFKAAIYMEGFASRQFFVDGNKRTAFACAKNFLLLNGYHLIVSNDEMYNVTQDVVNRRMNVHQLADWLETHSASI